MNTPPRILAWLLERLGPSDRPDLHGDFLELYARRVEEMGKFKADRKFLVDTIGLLPLTFISQKNQTPKTTIYMLGTYLKIARRNLVKNRLYSSINMIGLSVSLTACILITLFVRDELSYDKHYKDNERIFRIAGNYNHGGPERVLAASSSYLLLPALEGKLKAIDVMTRVEFRYDMISIDGSRQYMESEIIYADSTFFDIFSLPFVSGDRATALDDPSSVVIDEVMAHKYFENENAIGKFIQLKDKLFKVTGVMEEIPHNSHFTGRIIFPISGIVQWYPDWVLTNNSGTSVYTYFKSGKDFNQAEAKKSVNGLIASAKWGDPPPTFFFQPLTSIHLESSLNAEIEANGSKTNVYIFTLIALTILALAFVNYVNLSMAGSLLRTKEVGVKRVLGSTSGMQITQFQTESFIVILISAALAVLLASLSMPMFNSVSGKALELNLLHDYQFIAALFIVVVIIGFSAGSFPALTLLRLGTIKMLSGNLGSKGRKSYFRNGLIVFQFSISIALIASTLIVMDQINYIRKKDLGVDPEQLVMMPLTTTEIADRYELIKNELLRNPAVLNVCASSEKVSNAVASWRPYVIEGQKDNVTISSITVSHDFFETMGAKMIAGRSFSKDYPSDARDAYIVNESAAKFLHLSNPVGVPLTGFAFTGSKWTKKNAHIVGVVKDFNFASLHSEIGPVVFSLGSDITEGYLWIEARIANKNGRETIQALERMWKKIAPERPFQFEFMDDSIQQNYQAEDRFLKTFVLFSILSMLLGGLGLFGLTAFMTKRRTKEIGIRKIVGASTARLIRLLSKDFLRLVIISNLIGWPIAFYFMNGWLQKFAYRTEISFWPFVFTGLVAVVIAFAAILIHSLRASNANPVESLRHE